MECEICGAVTPLFRQNKKGVPGIWRCDRHNEKPIDPAVKGTVDAISQGVGISGPVIRAENPQQCDLCGKIAELRPYGPNGEYVCFECAKKDEPAMERAAAKRLTTTGADPGNASTEADEC